MLYYAINTNVGLDAAISNGDGYSINIKWFKAFSNFDGYSVAYQLYYSTNRADVFSEGVKFISYDGYLSADIDNLTPGQLYYFSVRPVEYNPIVVNPSLLIAATGNLKVCPETLLRQNISNTDLIIPLIDVADFPDYGVVQIGVELIQYLSVDRANNNLILTSPSQRGYWNTFARIHNIDGYDGYSYWNPSVRFSLGKEYTTFDRIYPCQSRFDLDYNAFTIADGYKQVTKDLLTTDLSGSDAYNEDFNSYDYDGWHRTDPVKLISGECVGSYLSGEQFCADGYDGVGRMLRGIPLQERILQRQEVLLSITGEPVVLIKRQRTGIVCNCVLPSSEYPDDRCPRCFAPGTLVQTEDGLRAIETINVGDRVLSSDGKYYKVTETIKTPFEGKLKSISTTTTTTPILATEDHPFLTLRGSHGVKNVCGPNSNCKAFIERGDGDAYNSDVRQVKSGRWHARVTTKQHGRKAIGTFNTKEEALLAVKEYKELHSEPGHTLKFDDAKNLKEKDWLVTKNSLIEKDIETIAIPQKFIKNTKLGMKRQGSEVFNVDEDFLWMIGLYLAEGSSGKRSITFALHKKEQSFVEKLNKIFNKYNYPVKTYESKKSNGISVTVHSSSLAKWFPLFLGKGCNNKKIPQELMNLPNNKSMAIINGIYDGDGSKREKEIVQTSEILALQMVDLLHRCGKNPLVRQQISKKLTPKGNKRKIAYCVNWEEDSLNRENRKGRWKFFEQKLTKVKKIEEIDYSGFVYNLEVEGDHTYIVQNILVHNCFGTKFVMGFEQYFNPRRSDGRIMVRFSPADEDLKMQEAGLESELITECWTLTVPTVKDRDILVRFDQDGNEEFRYEVLSVNRNRTVTQLESAQRMRVQRIRKFDIAYQINVFRDTKTLPTKINTSITNAFGIGPHKHEIVSTDQSIDKFSQLSSIVQGHNHQVVWDASINKLVVLEALGHTHEIFI